jgi:hypothetical protein
MAVVKDAHQVASVHRVSRADYYGVEPEDDDDRDAMWAHFIVQPDRLTHVAETHGTIAGFRSAHRLPDGTAP